MWKEENLKGETVSFDQIIESLELEDQADDFYNAILNYSDIEKYAVEQNFIIKNNKEAWMEIANALSGIITLDYTPKGNMQKYADEIYDLAKCRILNNVDPEHDYTIPELIEEVKEKIKVFTKLLFKLKCLDPKIIDETADKIIEKSESEYQKIVQSTADKIMMNLPGAMSQLAKDANKVYCSLKTE